MQVVNGGISSQFERAAGRFQSHDFENVIFFSRSRICGRKFWFIWAQVYRWEGPRNWRAEEGRRQSLMSRRGEPAAVRLPGPIGTLVVFLWVLWPYVHREWTPMLWGTWCFPIFATSNDETSDTTRRGVTTSEDVPRTFFHGPKINWQRHPRSHGPNGQLSIE